MAKAKKKCPPLVAISLSNESPAGMKRAWWVVRVQTASTDFCLAPGTARKLAADLVKAADVANGNA